MFKKILKWIKDFRKEKQRTFCYCPSCHNELISSGSFISDDEVVVYQCSKCEQYSYWNFDIAPVPLIIHLDRQPLVNKARITNMRLRGGKLKNV